MYTASPIGTFTFQSIRLDGEIEIEVNEWLTETELLDWDVRPAVEQRLYCNLGRRHGRSWAGKAPGGKPMGICGSITMSLMAVQTSRRAGTGVTLPFDADYAFQVVDDVIAYEWTWEGIHLGELLAGPLKYEVDSPISQYYYNPSLGETEITFAFETAWVMSTLPH